MPSSEIPPGLTIRWMLANRDLIKPQPLLICAWVDVARGCAWLMFLKFGF